MTTGATVNPSLATRTVLNSQTVTVSATVNGIVTKSIVIGGGVRHASPVEPVTWGRIKSIYDN